MYIQQISLPSLLDTVEDRAEVETEQERFLPGLVERLADLELERGGEVDLSLISGFDLDPVPDCVGVW